MNTDTNPPLTPEQAGKLLSADTVNIIKRVQSGKPLTREQRAMVLQLASGEESNTEKATARTLVELAEIMGVTRQTLTSWRKKEGAPKPASNGRHPLNEWRLFLQKMGVIESISDDGTSEEIEQLKLRKLSAEVAKREHELDVQKEGYLHKDDVRDAITRMVNEAIKLLRDKLENELPPVCAGLDAVSIRKENARVVDEFCEILSRGQV